MLIGQGGNLGLEGFQRLLGPFQVLLLAIGTGGRVGGSDIASQFQKPQQNRIDAIFFIFRSSSRNPGNFSGNSINFLDISTS